MLAIVHKSSVFLGKSITAGLHGLVLVLVLVFRSGGSGASATVPTLSVLLSVGHGCSALATAHVRLC